MYSLSNGIFTSGVLTAIAQECIQGKQNVLDMYDNSLTNIMLQQTCTQLFMYSDGDIGAIPENDTVSASTTRTSNVLGGSSASNDTNVYILLHPKLLHANV